MYSDRHFFHDLFRKYLLLFGTVFNDVTIKRFKSPDDTEPESIISVPIVFANKDKHLASVLQLPDKTLPKTSMVVPLPSMSYELTSVRYDSSRKLPTMNKITRVRRGEANNSTNVVTSYVGVPYVLGFRLYIYSNNIADASQIVEQILPYFTPDLTLRVKLIPELNIVHDIPITLQALSMEDNYEGALDSSRVILWSLDFTMQVMFYGPITKARTILFVHVPMYSRVDPSANQIAKVFVRPGLTANGQPTSDETQSIPAEQIFENDNYGIIIRYE